MILMSIIKQAQNLFIAAWDFENISKVLKSLKNLEMFFYSFSDRSSCFLEMSSLEISLNYL